MAKTKPSRFGQPGARRNIYADKPLWDYIEAKATEHYNRKMSPEAVELIEHGIRARDGEEALKLIQDARQAQVQQAKADDQQ